MNKSYRVKGLDCQNCANKLADKLAKIDGVNKVSIEFFYEKMHLDFVDDKKDYVLSEVKRICAVNEPDMKILGL